MFINKAFVYCGLFFLFSSFLYAQDSKNYNGSLIEYLTEANLNIETKMITEYCNCSDKKSLVILYQETAIGFNTILNRYISELTLLRSKKAIKKFNIINSNNWLRTDPFIKSASKALAKFQRFSGCDSNRRGFLPSSVAISEIAGIADTIIGLINSAKERKDVQKEQLIKILETLKIPSIQSYECKNEN
ncbi:hypothetical protein [Flavivirga algicola]|uniref:Uncharacterized protein n=1 Tax=Flavivirga algicola TaxID=2729136 RepID=A0ABX1S1C9_9FLAO|nr:hypothetical protein [Flavivirga algicola]NMH88234.1 hypothetical protein [Flavivirga algicola]